MCNLNFTLYDIDECLNHPTDPFPQLPGLVSESLLFYFNVINWSVLCLVISTIGTITNCINMAVFVNIGFKETINISLFALAVSDLGSCFTLILSNIFLNPWFQRLDLPFDPLGSQYILSAWPHVAFTKITTLITAFITFERYLCVSMPLKVRTILTRRRVISYLSFCYAFIVSLMIAYFNANKLGRQFYSDRNKTMFGYIFTEKREFVESVIVFPIFNVFLSGIAFVFIILFTALLVIKLKQTAKWRLKATGKGNKAIGSTDGNVDGAATAETKEQKVSKMVAILSGMFIVCFFPTVATQLAMWIDRRVAIDGQYSKMVQLLAYFTFTFESLNSAVNIGVYYKNSSVYKIVFDQIIKRKRQKQKR